MFIGFYARGNLDERAEFANKIFELIYRKYDGDLENESLLQEVKDIMLYLYEYVRNIYEIVDRECPMMALSQYHRYGFDETSFDDEDNMTDDKWLAIIKEACHRYYS